MWMSSAASVPFASDGVKRGLDRLLAVHVLSAVPGALGLGRGKLFPRSVRLLGELEDVDTNAAAELAFERSPAPLSITAFSGWRRAAAVAASSCSIHKMPDMFPARSCSVSASRRRVSAWATAPVRLMMLPSRPRVLATANSSPSRRRCASSGRHHRLAAWSAINAGSQRSWRAAQQVPVWRQRSHRTVEVRVGADEGHASPGGLNGPTAGR